MADTAPQRADLRAIVHLLTGILALALRFLSAPQAVVLVAVLTVHNVFVLPRTMPSLVRGRPPRPDAGLVTYPLSLLALLLILPARPEIVAACWAILAAGDGAASLVGRRGRATLPWNVGKTWEGSAAFAAAGAVAGGGAYRFVAGGDVALPPGAWSVAAAAVAASLAAATAESLRSRLDDNVRIVAAAALVLTGALRSSGDAAAAVVRWTGA